MDCWQCAGTALDCRLPYCYSLLHIWEETLLGLPGVLSGTDATAPNDGMLQYLAALLDNLGSTTICS